MNPLEDEKRTIKLTSDEVKFLQILLDPFPDSVYAPRINTRSLEEKGRKLVSSVVGEQAFSNIIDQYEKGGQPAVILTALAYLVAPPSPLRLHSSDFAQPKPSIDNMETTLTLAEVLEMRLSYITADERTAPRHFFTFSNPAEPDLAYYKVVAYLANFYILEQIARGNWSEGLRSQAFTAVEFYLSSTTKKYQSRPAELKIVKSVMRIIRKKDPLSLIRPDPGISLAQVFWNRFEQKRLRLEQNPHRYNDNTGGHEKKKMGGNTSEHIPTFELENTD